MNRSQINVTDWLAIQRTKLANERTFLAYFRTSVVILSSAFLILKIEKLDNLAGLSYGLMIVSVILITIGIIRFFYVSHRVTKLYKS